MSHGTHIHMSHGTRIHLSHGTHKGGMSHIQESFNLPRTNESWHTHTYESWHTHTFESWHAQRRYVTHPRVI